MSKALELRNERHSISLQMAAALDKSDMAQWRKLDGLQEDLRVQIDALERQSALGAELSAVRHTERPNITAPGEYGYSEGRRITQVDEIRSSKKYASDFAAYLRTGEQSAEMRALGVGGDGATLVPQGFEAELEIKLKAYGGMRRLCRILKTATGNPMPWPVMDDTTNVGEYLAESAPISNADPTFTAITFGANLCSSKQVLVPVQLEQDSAFDMGSLLTDAFAVRIARTENKAFTVGNTDPIVGLITALVAAGGRSVLAVGANANSDNSADTDLNSIGTDDLVNLIAKVDPAYRAAAPKRCQFAANKSTWDHLRTLKDKYGRPIWQVSLGEAVPDTLLGYGYDYNQDIAAIGAGNISVVFGNWDHAVIRDVLGFTIVRFNELYMVNHQRGYQALARHDFKLLQPAAFSYLIHPDS